jgi:S-adenosylmethionine hydrolase
VIKRIAPQAEIIDITHGIAPQHVLQGALVLAETLPYMPIGVHVAVVDPGVGGPRRPIALRGGDGRLYVGPDNGILLVAVERLGGIERIVELTNPSYRLEPVSPTFHGRDVFAPAAGHLLRGVSLEELGPPLRPSGLVTLELPRAQAEPGRIRATVLAVDRFGNLRLNIAGTELGRSEIECGDLVDIEIADRRSRARVALTFADVEPGEMLLYEDSSGSLSLAVNRGSAARTLSAVVGQEIAVDRERR